MLRTEFTTQIWWRHPAMPRDKSFLSARPYLLLSPSKIYSVLKCIKGLELKNFLGGSVNLYVFKWQIQFSFRFCISCIRWMYLFMCLVLISLLIYYFSHRITIIYRVRVAYSSCEHFFGVLSSQILILIYNAIMNDWLKKSSFQRRVKIVGNF